MKLEVPSMLVGTYREASKKVRSEAGKGVTHLKRYGKVRPFDGSVVCEICLRVSPTEYQAAKWGDEYSRLDNVARLDLLGDYFTHAFTNADSRGVEGVREPIARAVVSSSWGALWYCESPMWGPNPARASIHLASLSSLVAAHGDEVFYRNGGMLRVSSYVASRVLWWRSLVEDIDCEDVAYELEEKSAWLARCNELEVMQFILENGATLYGPLFGDMPEIELGEMMSSSQEIRMAAMSLSPNPVLVLLSDAVKRKKKKRVREEPSRKRKRNRPR